MKIAIIGYGKMGHVIEQIARERGHEIVLTIDKDNTELLDDRTALSAADVAIEFSSPEAAVHHLEACFKAGLAVVCGTTGWLDRWEDVVASMKRHDGTLFYASNFSVGVYVFSKINALLAQYMNRLEDYDVSLEEIHHIHKKDAPSGTALSLAESIVTELDRKSEIKTIELHEGEEVSSDRSQNKNALTIVAKRIGETPGTHAVEYHSEVDDIYIRHTAHGRRGFALGAVMAAEHTKGKKGLLSMDELFA